MSGNNVAIDSSAAISFMKGHPSTVALLRTCTALHLPAIALGELLFGVVNSGQQAAAMTQLQAFLVDCAIFLVTGTTASRYADIRFVLQRAGRPIPVNDIWIAATCLEHNLPLVTTDTHFQQVAGLQVIPPS